MRVTNLSAAALVLFLPLGASALPMLNFDVTQVASATDLTPIATIPQNSSPASGLYSLSPSAFYDIAVTAVPDSNGLSAATLNFNTGGATGIAVQSCTAGSEVTSNCVGTITNPNAWGFVAAYTVGKTSATQIGSFVIATGGHSAGEFVLTDQKNSLADNTLNEFALSQLAPFGGRADLAQLPTGSFALASVLATVPEPSTAVLFGFGAMGLAVASRRRPTRA